MAVFVQMNFMGLPDAKLIQLFKNSLNNKRGSEVAAYSWFHTHTASTPKPTPCCRMPENRCWMLDIVVKWRSRLGGTRCVSVGDKDNFESEKYPIIFI
jgi:hypothetical protein